MDAEQKKFLQKRLRSAAAEQPELKKLKNLLCKLGGEMLVPPMSPDHDLPALMERGFCMGGPVLFKIMEDSACHSNIAALWNRKRRQVIGIATGYALSDDGLWRQHTWGILREGLLETTTERLKYFGILLQGEDADRFACSNP